VDVVGQLRSHIHHAVSVMLNVQVAIGEGNCTVVLMRAGWGGYEIDYLLR